ncbi:hypothetical protein CEUSTIGMA_g5272.t1 [Chlamydomonas eustigma]|uniref:Reverse transcriptase domain-containing protein n=1 Tax=Chlamydomonas eustigma TaxID=1157962 RepID=A0A250X4I5_9CHLO|nr:hypothetical protein CEUSTIGMA_g5272.t1 [Chlamydomonas eustigma]|eukprot:GAX77829.1 hypothetical protein CEUSTIGMA_g5272.t1 [Chlamydomonas eustigma]
MCMAELSFSNSFMSCCGCHFSSDTSCLVTVQARQLLRQSLKSYGMTTCSTLYINVSIRVRHDGVLGRSRPRSHQGFKQGDPLSPLLFGMLIDPFEKLIAVRLPCL